MPPAALAAVAARHPLRLKETKDGRAAVQGAAEAEVASAGQALQVLRRAVRARAAAATGANQQSSRSHAVFSIKVERRGGAAAAAAAAAVTAGGEQPPQEQQQQQQHGAGGNQQQQQQQQLASAAGGGSSDGGGAGEGGGACFLHFVDLAGCERAARTGNAGARLRESVAINSSLMALARCLEVLRYNQMRPNDARVVPYRESKVTHMFRAALTGRGRFALLVNVSPAAAEFGETKRVLEVRVRGGGAAGSP